MVVWLWGCGWYSAAAVSVAVHIPYWVDGMPQHGGCDDGVWQQLQCGCMTRTNALGVIPYCDRSYPLQQLHDDATKHDDTVHTTTPERLNAPTNAATAVSMPLPCSHGLHSLAHHLMHHHNYATCGFLGSDAAVATETQPFVDTMQQIHRRITTAMQHAVFKWLQWMSPLSLCLPPLYLLQPPIYLFSFLFLFLFSFRFRQSTTVIRSDLPASLPSPPY